ncbi:uncharacterized protein LOC134228044 [Armigeres subalbatus]|uniref:uncharacterized protein LOC134228044 n=1 Tax=Armigeres subalbatus TaxID=124917 RepID=UPI002ED4FB15
MWTSTPEALDRDEIAEKDALSKLVSKHYADSKRGAKISNLNVGDKVILTQLKRFKSDPMFGSERFTIVARDGAKIVVRSDRGVLFTRNVADAKRITEDVDNDGEIRAGEITEKQMATELNADNDLAINPTNDVENQITGYDFPPEDRFDKAMDRDSSTSSDGRNERPKRAHQKPRKFDDMVLYTIFE